MHDLRFIRIGSGYVSERVLLEFFEKIKDEPYFHPFCITAQFAKAVVDSENNDEFWFFYIDNFLTGYGFIRGWYDNWPEKVLGIVIEPEEREKGYGELFCRLLEFVAKKRGVENLRLHVNKNNTEAYNLYRKLGYLFSGGQTDKGDLIGRKDL